MLRDLCDPTQVVCAVHFARRCQTSSFPRRCVFAGPTGSDPCGIGLCCSNEFACVYDFDNSDLTCCESRPPRMLSSVKDITSSDN